MIRKAERRDAQTLHDFVLKLDRNGAPVRMAVMTVEDIRAAGFGPDPLFEALIAERQDGMPLGAISFFRGYSGWLAAPIAVVHLLFVNEEARGKGVGSRLMAAVAKLAVDRGWPRVELLVEKGSSAARFYEAIGMAASGDRHYRIEGSALAVLAGNGDGSPSRLG